MLRAKRVVQAIVMALNAVMAGCFAFVPHSYYFGSYAFPDGSVRDPTLERLAPFFYLLAGLIAAFSLIFWYTPRRWLWLPILFYAFLGVFLSVAQSAAFLQSSREGWLLLAMTALPAFVIAAASVWLRRPAQADGALK